MTSLALAPLASRMKMTWWAAATGSFLVILAAKLILIDHYGSPVPRYDEWGADAANLLVPLLDGRLTLQDLLAPHNEHRILLTRLLVLAIFELSGRWDVIAQMEINAALHAASLVWIALMLADAASDRRDTTAALTVLLIAVCGSVIPFGMGNTLQGFQTQFYLLIALSFGCIVLLVPAAAFSWRWLAGVVLGAVSLFSVASGALSLCPPLGVACLQMLRGHRQGAREAAGIVVLAVLTVLLLLCVPTVPADSLYRAHSIGQFLHALVQASAWPVGGSLFFITQGPSWVAGGAIIAIATSTNDPRWRLVAALVWVAIQALAVSWSRAIVPWESRYLDIYLIGQIVGAASAMFLLGDNRLGWLGRRLIQFGVMVWLVAILGSYIQTGFAYVPRNLHGTQQIALDSASHLRDYMARAPDKRLQNNGWMGWVYPDAQALRQILDNPAMKAVMPASIGGSAPENWLASMDKIVLQAAPALLGTGVVLLASAVTLAFREWRRRLGQGDGCGPALSHRSLEAQSSPHIPMPTDPG